CHEVGDGRLAPLLATAKSGGITSAQTALGRIGEPEDVAHVIAMLLSQDGQWINGQSIDVSGGYNL
ncbi:SDR family oxidoreductase, partial [Xanthomonas phaseoli]|uniref:SDR family oxidoreductase n=1 Tax=Xanthomonas phaseoli TaxID=1985254 RepID=UPI001ED95629